MYVQSRQSSMAVVSDMDGGISFVVSPMGAIESWHCTHNTHLPFSFISLKYGCLLLGWNMKYKPSVSLTEPCVDAKMNR